MKINLWEKNRKIVVRAVCTYWERMRVFFSEMSPKWPPWIWWVYLYGKVVKSEYLFFLRLNFSVFVFVDYVPTTSISTESMTVAKLGASADTSHVYFPVILGVRFSSTTCDSFDCVICFGGKNKL